MTEASAVLHDKKTPETLEHSMLAEFAASVCRDIAGGLLGATGEEVEQLLQREISRLQEALDDPSVLKNKITPRHAPVFNRRGQVAIAKNPVISFRNAIAPPMVLVHAGGENQDTEFTVELPLQYEGPPGKLHGGYSGVLLDEAIWKAVRMRVPGINFTRELTINYERPVPLFEPVTIVSRVTKIDGRKTFAEGEIIAGGEVCSRGSGLWLSPRPRE